MLSQQLGKTVLFVPKVVLLASKKQAADLLRGGGGGHALYYKVSRFFLSMLQAHGGGVAFAHCVKYFGVAGFNYNQPLNTPSH